jgi:hypothetical protein
MRGVYGLSNIRSHTLNFATVSEIGNTNCKPHLMNTMLLSSIAVAAVLFVSACGHDEPAPAPVTTSTTTTETQQAVVPAPATTTTETVHSY